MIVKDSYLRKIIFSYVILYLVPEVRELTYEFLLLCSTGPYAKRPPADWARIQKECPNIVRKVHQCDTNANHLMYDSVTY